MDRSHPQPGWIVLLAALSEVATAAPSRADAGLFEFNGAWLSEQTADVDPGLLDGARRLRLDGFQVGSLRLGMDIQKAALPADPLRAFHYTVADARKDWLRSLSADQPRRLSLSGAVDRGAARGLSFHVTRNEGARDAAVESQLSFSRSGFSADIQIRNVGGHFARSALMDDDEWNRLKDIVGWKQTDMRFKWQAMPGLSLASELSKGAKSGSGDSRNHRRLSLEWKPAANSHLSLYNEVNAAGKQSGSSRTTKRGFAWNQSWSGFTFGLSQDETRAEAGKHERIRTLSFATPEKSATRFTYKRTEARQRGGASTMQAMTFHSRPMNNLSLAADYTLTTGGERRRNRGMSVDWKPSERWRLNGEWRHDTDAVGPMADLRLVGDPNNRTHVDARLQRITDPKQPYRRKNAVRIERRPGERLQWSVQYAALQTKQGESAKTLEAIAKVKTSKGGLTAEWRDGDADVLPGYTDVGFSTGSGKTLNLTAHLRRREDALNTQTVDLKWKASNRLTLTAAYERNPEDTHGHPQDLDSCRIAFAYDVSDDLHLKVSRGFQNGVHGHGEQTDFSLKGRLDGMTTLDVGVALHHVPSLPAAAAYHLSVERTVDDDNYLQLAVERKTRAVQKKDDFTASMNLVSVF